MNKDLQKVLDKLESMIPNSCDCTGAKYECEHWGRHEAISEIQEFIKEIIK